MFRVTLLKQKPTCLISGCCGLYLTSFVSSVMNNLHTYESFTTSYSIVGITVSCSLYKAASVISALSLVFYPVSEYSQYSALLESAMMEIEQSLNFSGWLGTDMQMQCSVSESCSLPMDIGPAVVSGGLGRAQSWSTFCPCLKCMDVIAITENHISRVTL